MMEFTFSRVTICICGMLLLLAVTGAVHGVYDSGTDEMDRDLAERTAHMLDVFQASGSDRLILDGSGLLPDGYQLRVHDGFVELLGENGIYVASTAYEGSFELGWNDAIEIGRRRSRLSF